MQNRRFNTLNTSLETVQNRRFNTIYKAVTALYGHVMSLSTLCGDSQANLEVFIYVSDFAEVRFWGFVIPMKAMRAKKKAKQQIRWATLAAGRRATNPNELSDYFSVDEETTHRAPKNPKNQPFFYHGSKKEQRLRLLSTQVRNQDFILVMHARRF